VCAFFMGNIIYDTKNRKIIRYFGISSSIPATKINSLVLFSDGRLGSAENNAIRIRSNY